MSAVLLLRAASHALRSYEQGNSSPALAKSIADRIDAFKGTSIIVRDAMEIQRAHDMLYAIVVEKLPLNTPPKPELAQAMRDSLDILCWVLHHDHNPTFAADLKGIQECLELQGVAETKAMPI